MASEPSAQFCQSQRDHQQSWCDVYRDGIDSYLRCSPKNFTEKQIERIRFPWKEFNAPGVDNSSCEAFLSSTCKRRFDQRTQWISCIHSVLNQNKNCPKQDHQFQKCFQSPGVNNHDLTPMKHVLEI